MRKSYITVYDLQMRRVAELENAFTVSYETPLNALWTASFSLPANDEKNVECKPLYFVEIYDGDERLELFRIIPNTTKRSSDGQTVTYQCEHVLATLLDDVLFQYHTIGNLGVYTLDVISYILSKQNVQRWQVGTTEISRQFEYNWENENLLGALLSVPKPFDEEYMWTFDTTVYPWRVNLVRPAQQEQVYIRYGVNLQGIEKVEDPSNIVTRLYGLGYGEGVNQLTFADINGGKPYIDAEPEYIARYGVLSSIFVDRRFEYPETLLARCQALLNESKEQRLTYTVDAAEIYSLTRDPIDRFKTGVIVRVIDEELGVDIRSRVLNVRKGDIFGQPGTVQLEIANKSQDIAGSIAELRNRQYINEVYAQGATNYQSHDFADNCDPQHPAILKFYVPEETARINKASLSYSVEAFRGYSKAIESAPAITSGPSSKTTSGPSSKTTTASGGSSTPTTSTKEASIESSSTLQGWSLYSIDVPDYVSVSDDHNHGITPGTRLAIEGGGSVTFEASGGHTHHLTTDHKHSVTVPSHSHTVTIPAHTHEMDHTHDMNHTHEIPAHTHEIQFGIYEGPTPSAITIKVDGNIIAGLGTSGEEIDIIPYLSKDDSGRIQRGTFHTIEIAPNSLGRIVASVHEQIFVQSRGGGNY
ncbi:Prophage endopeptidase tail [compost metagenome]